MAGPDTKNAETPYPIWGFDPPSPEPDTKKLDALLASLNGSAERFQTLWFSFLGVTLYLAIAALATTHRNLLLGEPQTLPILNIKVELLPFYVIAPLLYLVFHFYLLMMLALLARTAAEFDKQLRTTLPGEPERERYRAQVGNALFLQLLVGMKGERTGVNALLMGLIALITIVLAPLATLVLTQMMFLPYHHLRITWWHRGIVVADLVLIVVMTYRCFFPRGVSKAPLVLGALSRKPRWATAMTFWVLLASLLTPFAYWLSFSQGRWAGEPKASSIGEWAKWMAGKQPELPEVNPGYAATARGVVFGLFPDRLKLVNETIVGKDKLEKTKEEIASRGSDFVPTIDLDFRDLQAANLYGADLRGVSLSRATLRGANLESVRLDDARLYKTQLQGADLRSAQLQDADLRSAQLQGANLSSARLQGTDLRYAQLQGADLQSAQLQGADLRSVQSQGARLSYAQLQGAYLELGQLQGADLRYAQMQGTNLRAAQLQGADLDNADLQGANLTLTELQGANLMDAAAAYSEFDETFVFRTETYGWENWSPTSIIRCVLADKVRGPQHPPSSAEPYRYRLGLYRGDCVTNYQALQPSDISNWIAASTEFVHRYAKIHVIKRFDLLKNGSRYFDGDSDEKNQWSEAMKGSSASDRTQLFRVLADHLSSVVCDAGGAPYVARGLLNNGRFGFLGDQFSSLLLRLEEGRKDAKKCRGVVGFTEEDWRRVEAIKPARAVPSDR
jgi:uncharacterized protein YjbI with pentapeptide repeats